MDPLIFAGWKRVVFDVTVWSSAPRADVLALVETTHRTSPMLANLSPRVEQVFQVRIEAGSERKDGERFVPREVTPSR
jgi:hypothetical protein